MPTTERRVSSATARSLLWIAGSPVAVLLAYVAVWRVAAPQTYLQLILATYLLLAVAAIALAGRVVRSRDWLHALGAIALLVGLAVTVFAGLQPRPDCLDFGPCPQRGIMPHPRWLVAGGLLTTCGIVLDLRRSV